MSLKNYTSTQKLTAKDVETLLVSVSPGTAKQYLKDIKQSFGVSVVLFCHFCEYFKIAIPA